MVNPFFSEAYRAGRPPWDIGRAQPAFVELAEAGQIKGSVLDLGCGTGDNVLEMAERGHEAWGIDIVPNAIDQAKAKAKLRGLDATFLVGDALEAGDLNRTFDTILDCGLFHTFSDPERELYAQQIAALLPPGGHFHLMALSDWEDASWGGPRRVSQAEIIDTFRMGFRVDDIEEARFLVLPPFRIKGHAWLASLVRESDPVKPKAKRKSPVAPRKKETAKPTVRPKGKPLPILQASAS